MDHIYNGYINYKYNIIKQQTLGPNKGFISLAMEPANGWIKQEKEEPVKRLGRDQDYL